MDSFKEKMTNQRLVVPQYSDPDKYYEPWEFNDDEMIRRVMDKEELKNIIGRRAFYAANDQRDRELAELWVTGRDAGQTACLGANWGYYIGMDAIRRHYVNDYVQQQYDDLAAIAAKNTNIQVNNLNLGWGCTHFTTATTPLLRIAGDGKTARGLWYCVGQDTRAKADGSAEAWWIYQTMGVDFLHENGQWKIWHLVECLDYVCQAGVSFQAGSVDGIPEEQIFVDRFGTPTISMTVHNPRYNWGDNFPSMPMPYFTFNSENSYGPEGNPYFKRVKK